LTKKKVRCIIVEGDWFFVNDTLVSSHTHFKLLPKLSPIIDRLPRIVISYISDNWIPYFEKLFTGKLGY